MIYEKPVRRELICRVNYLNKETLQRDMEMSSILRIIRTHSVARVIALVDTRVGWTMFYLDISSMMFFLMLSPAYTSPASCLFLNSVTKTMGSIPAFSARVLGITSRDWANLSIAYWSRPGWVLAKSVSLLARYIYSHFSRD